VFHFKRRNNEYFEDDTSALLFRAIQRDRWLIIIEPVLSDSLINYWISQFTHIMKQLK
jgi:hypothetical protein